jgi:hypothetical protein
MTLRNRADLAALPRYFVADAIANIDTSTETGLAAAKLRMATELGKCLKASTLIAACRVHGIKHIVAGHQAAYALASIAFVTSKVGSH